MWETSCFRRPMESWTWKRFAPWLCRRSRCAWQAAEPQTQWNHKKLKNSSSTCLLFHSHSTWIEVEKMNESQVETQMQVSYNSARVSLANTDTCHRITGMTLFPDKTSCDLVHGRKPWYKSWSRSKRRSRTCIGAATRARLWMLWIQAIRYSTYELPHWVGQETCIDCIDNVIKNFCLLVLLGFAGKSKDKRRSVAALQPTTCIDPLFLKRQHETMQLVDSVDQVEVTRSKRPAEQGGKLQLIWTSMKLGFSKLWKLQLKFLSKKLIFNFHKEVIW